MASSSEYWKQRFDQVEQAANNQSVRYTRQLEKKYQAAAQELDKQINAWYRRLADNNGVSMTEARKLLTNSELKEFKWTVEEYVKYGQQNAIDQSWMKELENASAKFHINRLEALKLEARQQVEQLFAGGQESMYDTLADVYKDTFYRSCYEIQKGVGIGFDVSKLDDSKVSKLLLKPWSVDGTNFSEKLWGNKRKLINTLDQELSRMVLTGESPRTAIANIRKAMDTSQFAAKRLVLTEQAYFTSIAQKDSYSELDVEEYEIVATIDGKTSKICQEMDGNHFPVKNMVVGVNAPPFHVCCRSTTCPYFDDEFTIGELRVGKNVQTGETNYFPANMTYEEWYARYIKTSPESQMAITKEQHLAADKKQYKDYVKRLGKEYVPATVDEFQNVKYGNSNEYGILKAQYKGMMYYENAVNNEPLITSSVKTVAKSTKMNTYGLEYRLKTKDSYLRKIRSKYKPDGNSYEVKDIIRYTLGTEDADVLVERMSAAIDEFTEMGYNTTVLNNTWNNAFDPYNGINTTLVAPNGQKFEVQYHTKESFDLKNGEMHKLYEQARLIDDTDSVEYIELKNRMFELSDTLNVPKDIGKVKSYGK